MKFLQLLAFYEEYTRDFLARNPDLPSCSYAEQNARMLADGFSLIHTFARYLGPRGFETEAVYTDCEPTQRKWMAERGLTLSRPENWRHEIAAHQVNASKPDILYITEPVGFDRRFLDLLEHRPRLILAWKAAAIPAGTDWHGIDVILSNFSPTFPRALEIGARSTEFITPGFPESLADELPDEGKIFDVSFMGSISSEHRTRNTYLDGLAQAPFVNREGFTLGYFLRTAEPSIVPPAIAAHNRGGLWGHGMHRALKSSRIALNIGIDLAKGETGNMRMIEATGLGTFLLTEYQDNIRKYFEPGVECDTFASAGELHEKIQYYLAHPEAREAIARRGRDRCRRDFSMTRSVQRLEEIIHRHLAAKEAPIGQLLVEKQGRQEG